MVHVRHVPAAANTRRAHANTRPQRERRRGRSRASRGAQRAACQPSHALNGQRRRAVARFHARAAARAASRSKERRRPCGRSWLRVSNAATRHADVNSATPRVRCTHKSPPPAHGQRYGPRSAPRREGGGVKRSGPARGRDRRALWGAPPTAQATHLDVQRRLWTGARGIALPPLAHAAAGRARELACAPSGPL